MQTLVEVLKQSWLLVLEASPYLLFGFVLAGLMHAFLPIERIVHWMGRPNWRSVFNAAVIGTPLPLCSCSVVPVADSLRKGGASKGATTAFLISTPESGLDSIAVTYGLMDPIMTIARPIAAILTALAAGVAQNIWGGEQENGPKSAGQAQDSDAKSDRPSAKSMCCSNALPGRVSETARSRGGADNKNDLHTPQEETLTSRLIGGLRYALGDMFEDLAKYFVVGFLIAGALAVALDKYDPVRSALHSAWAPFVMLLAGIPMYVCASAATPMVAVLIAQGLSPGAALVFLLAGPATNAASIVVLQRILGRRAVAIYLAIIMVSALVLGYALEGVYALAGVAPRALEGMHSEHARATWLHWISAVVVVVLISNGLWRHYFCRTEPKHVATE